MMAKVQVSIGNLYVNNQLSAFCKEGICQLVVQLSTLDGPSLARCLFLDNWTPVSSDRTQTNQKMKIQRREEEFT